MKVLKDKFVLSGLIILTVLVLLVVIGPVVFRGDPNLINYVSDPLAPSLVHPFGTDDLGRDMFLRIINGGRISLLVAFVAVSISLSIGTIIGCIAGYYKGKVDEIIMRSIDVFIAIPTIFLLLTIQILLKPNIYNVIVVIGLTSWMGTARIVRAEVLAISAREFVTAARSFGFSNFTILFRHILPNALGSLIAMAILSMAGAILTESALSYFGLGVQPPYPSWGNMLTGAQEYMLQAWWMMFFPGVFILITVLSLNFIGDGLFRVFNPRD